MKNNEEKESVDIYHQFCDSFIFTYLVIWTLIALELGKASTAHCVSTPKADGPALATIKLMAADGARQELRPLGGLDRHAPRLVLLVNCRNTSCAISEDYQWFL